MFGTDPRQGYFVGNHFYHPELRFELTFPAGWKTQNSRSSVMAAERHVTVHCMDAYQSLNMLPPPERRGIVLIDSSFDRAREFERIRSFLERYMATQCELASST